MTLPDSLWHYTCQHGRDRIGYSGTLIPASYGVIWLTDMEQPDRDALGLTARMLQCDRTQYRYRVIDRENVMHYPRARGRLVPIVVCEQIESAHGALPMHWYICATPLRAVFDQWSWAS